MSHHSTHASHYRSLFRAILRGIEKIRPLKSAISNVQSSNRLVQQEIAKFSVNPELYHRHLLAEIRQLAWEEFLEIPKHLKDVAVFSKLSEGLSFVKVLQAIKERPEEPEGWGQLMEALVGHRSNQLKKYHWKRQYDAHKTVIDQGRLKNVPTLLAKRIVSREQKARKTELRYSSLSPSRKAKAYTSIVKASKENAAFVVRNYLKRMQLAGKVPNPYKLPYMRPKVLAQSADLPETREILPGSTKMSILEEAYDMDYIESITKPEIEYRINESYFLKKYSQIVNEKGPFKVQLRTTMAGAMPAHFLRLPYAQLRLLEAMAMDIKNLVRLARKQFLWNLDSAAAGSISDKPHGEGYAVRGSGGFTIEEIMYPRSYYENLAAEEAAWEFRMEVRRLEANWNKIQRRTSDVDDQLRFIYTCFRKSWEEPLIVATQKIDKEMHRYYKKYRILEESDIWKRRKALQEKMNFKYSKLIDKLEKLASIIQKNQVSMHLDLFNLNKTQNRLYEGRIIQEEKVLPRIRRGIPERGGAGLGRTLGDFMQEVGLRGFKMGEKFDKRLNWVVSGATDQETGGL